MGEGAVGRAPVDNDRQGVHAIPYGATSWGTHHTATTTEPIQNPPTHHASTTAVFRHGMARFTGGHARCRAEHLAYSGEPLSRTRHWSRRPTAFAPLRLSGAAHRQRSASKEEGRHEADVRR